MLNNVDITYVGDNVEQEEVTTSAYKTYFNGSEIIVAGKLLASLATDSNVLMQVSANSLDGPLVYQMNIEEDDRLALELPPTVNLGNKFERLWAYLTIKDTLNKMLQATNATVKAALKQQALDLSLQVGLKGGSWELLIC